jgi:hypothetical protein
MLSTKKAYIIRVLLPVFLGGGIYCSLRDPNFVLLKLTNNNILHNLISSLHQISMPVAGFFPRWFSYSLPDALWCYACISLIAIYWRGGPFIFKVLWLGVAIALSLGFEVGQYWNMVPGTFCGGDLVFSVGAIALALSHDVLRKMYFKTGLGNTLSAGSSRPPISV